MKRFIQRRDDYYKALDKLKEALHEEETEIVIDGVLHRFEFTFELAWKTVKDYLEYMGIIEKVGSPREVIKAGYKTEIIEEAEEWIQMMLSRNELSHLYDEETSRKIYKQIKEKYIKLLEGLQEKFEQIL